MKHQGLFILLLAFLVLLSGSVQAQSVNVSTDQYTITCTPETTLVQYNYLAGKAGFTQYCDYTWHKNYTLVRDVAFCFDTLLTAGRLYYHDNSSGMFGDPEEWTDVTGQFNSVNISSHVPVSFTYYNNRSGNGTLQRIDGNLTQPYCYYIRNVAFHQNNTIKTQMFYQTKDYENVKWSTLFGNITARRVDVFLDPFYDSTHYEIGTFRSASYYWGTTAGVLNGDVRNSTGNLNPYLNFITNSRNVGNGNLTASGPYTMTATNSTHTDNEFTNITTTGATITWGTTGRLAILRGWESVTLQGTTINGQGQGQDGGAMVKNSNCGNVCQGRANGGSGAGAGGGVGYDTLGGGCYVANDGYGGGGAGYGTSGQAGGGSKGGGGGGTYGTTTGEDFAMGSGGGGGTAASNCISGSTARGGNGGGALYLSGYNVTLENTTIDLRGNVGGTSCEGGGGGGGSGGMLILEGQYCNLKNVSILVGGGAGAGGVNGANRCDPEYSGGTGGYGRVRFKCANQDFASVTIDTSIYNATATYSDIQKTNSSIISQNISIGSNLTVFKANFASVGNVLVNVALDGILANAVPATNGQCIGWGQPQADTLAYFINLTGTDATIGSLNISLDTPDCLANITFGPNTSPNGYAITELIINITTTNFTGLWQYSAIDIYNYTGGALVAEYNTTDPTYQVNASLPDGTYKFNATAYYSNQNITTETRTVTLDTTPPTIDYNSFTDLNGYVYARRYVQVGVDAVDAAFANLTIYLYNSTGGLIDSYYSTNPSVNHTFTVTYDGTFSFNATAYSSSPTIPNSVSTTTRSITANENLAVLNYPMDENGGNFLTEISGNNWTADVNGASNTYGKIAYGRKIEASGMNITGVSFGINDSTNQSYTFWIKTNQTIGGGETWALMERTSNSGNKFGVYYQPGVLTWLYDSLPVTYNINLTPNQWYFISLTYDVVYTQGSGGGNVTSGIQELTWFPFDTVGGYPQDYGTANNSMTTSGGSPSISTSTYKVGTASLSLPSRATTYFGTTNITGYVDGNHDMCVMYWAYWNANPLDDTVWFAGVASTSNMISVGASLNNNIDWNMYSNNANPTVPTRANGAWYHFVESYTASDNNVSVWQNGTFITSVATGAGPANWTFSTGTMTFGSTGGNGANAYVDDFRVVNVSCTQAMVDYVYNGGTGTIASLSQMAPPTTQPGELAWYKGEDYADSSGNGYYLDGTSGSVSVVGGKLGNAFNFATGSKYTNSTYTFMTGNQAHSYCYWLNTTALPTSGTNMYHIGIGANSGTSASSAGFSNPGSGAVYQLRNPSNGNNTYDITWTTGDWHHVCVAYYPTNHLADLYYDGVKHANALDLIDNVSFTSSSFIILGNDIANGGGSLLNALMDDVRVYDVTLDDSQVGFIYNGGAGTTASLSTYVPSISTQNLTIVLKMDETDGLVLINNVTGAPNSTIGNLSGFRTAGGYDGWGVNYTATNSAKWINVSGITTTMNADRYSTEAIRFKTTSGGGTGTFSGGEFLSFFQSGSVSAWLGVGTLNLTKLEWFYYNAGTQEYIGCPNNVEDGQWHTAVLTMNGGENTTLYLDDVLCGSVARYTAVTSLPAFYLHTLAPQYSGATDTYTGSLDEFYHWDRVLSRSEISVLSTQDGVYPFPSSSNGSGATTAAFHLVGYVNAQNVTSGNSTIAVPAGNSSLTIGSALNGSDVAYGVKFDEYSIWNRRLNQSQIEALYANGAGMPYPFTVAAGFNLSAYSVVFPYPNNGYARTNNFTYNFTTADPFYSYAFFNMTKLFGDGASYTFTTVGDTHTFLNLPEGKYYYSLLLNDYQDNSHYYDPNVTLDITIPYVEFQPPTPTNGSFVTNNITTVIHSTDNIQINSTTVYLYNTTGLYANYTSTNLTCALTGGVNPLYSDVALYYKFDNDTTNATNTIDTKQGLVGRYVNNVTHGWPGELNQALKNTPDGYVDTGYVLNSSTDVTFSAWVKIDGSLGQNGIIGDWDDGPGPDRLFFYYNHGSTALFLNFYDVTNTFHQASYTTTFSTGVWYHVMFKINTTDAIVYLNNNAGTPLASGGGLRQSDAANTTLMDRVSSNLPLDGTMDEVAIWNRALSDAEMTTLYNSGSVLPYSTNVTCASNTPTPEEYAWYGQQGFTDLSNNFDLTQIGPYPPVVNTTFTKVSGKSFQQTITSGGTKSGAYVNTTMPTGNKDLSYCAWLYPTEAMGGSGRGFAGMYFGSGGNYESAWFIINGADGYRFQINSDGSPVSGAWPATDTWTHVCYTYNASASNFVKIIVNGGEANYTGNIGNTPNFQDPAIMIFNAGLRDNSTWDSGYRGYMDDVRFYNKTISPAEAAFIYNGGAGTNQSISEMGYTPGSSATAIDFNHTFLNLSWGTYYLSASATDNANWTNTTETRTIIAIPYFPTGLYNVTFWFNDGAYTPYGASLLLTSFTTTDPYYNHTEYNLTKIGGAQNITYTNETSLIYENVTDGVYVYSLRLFDNAGNNQLYGPQNITVDSTAPIVTYATPPTPLPDAYVKTNFTVEVDIDDPNFANDANVSFRLYNASGLVQAQVRTVANCTNGTGGSVVSVVTDDVGQSIPGNGVDTVLRGMVIEINSTIPPQRLLNVTFATTFNGTRAQLRPGTPGNCSGTLLQERPIINYVAEFNYDSLTPGSQYCVLADSNGSQYDQGYLDWSTWPIIGTNLKFVTSSLNSDHIFYIQSIQTGLTTNAPICSATFTPSWGYYTYDVSAMDLAGNEGTAPLQNITVIPSFQTQLYNNTFPYANNAYTNNNTLTHGFSTIDPYYDYALYNLTKYNAAQGPSSLLTGLRAYYSFDTANPVDNVSLTNFTVSSGYWNATAKMGGGFTFDGTGTALQYASASHFPGGANTPWTYSLWVNIRSIPTTGVFRGFFNWGSQNPYLGTYGGIANDYGACAGSGYTLVVGMWGSGGAPCIPYAYTGNSWHHYIYTFDGAGNYSAYVDGVFVGSGIDATATNIPTSGQEAALPMGIDTGNTLTGTVDELGVWNRTLTPTEITTLYNGGAGRNPYDPAPATTETLTNTSNMSITYTSLEDALYYYGVTVYDRAGNYNLYDPNVTIDTTPPNLTYITPPTPTNGAFLKNITVEVNVTEINLANVTLSIFNDTGIVTTATQNNCTGGCFITATPPWGTYYFNATAYDLAGNTGNAETRNATVIPALQTQWYNVTWPYPENAYTSNNTLSHGFSTIDPYYSNTTYTLRGQNICTITNSTLDNDLIFYSSLDDTTSGYVDMSPLNHSATITGTANTTGIHNGALEFDGTNPNYIQYSGVNISQLRTFSLWLKTNSSSGTRAAFDHPGATAYALYQFNNYYEYYGGGGGLGPQTATIATGAWHHVAGTYDPVTTNRSIYLDGVYQNSGLSPFDDAITTLWIGSDPFSQYFFGTIDEVGMWNRTLNNSEILELYNSGVGTFYNGASFGSSCTSSNETNTTTTATSITYTGLADGQYYYGLTIRDFASNEYFYDPNVTIDTINPSIDFTTPTEANGSYIDTRDSIIVNLTLNDTNLNSSATLISLYNASGLIATSTGASTYTFTNLTNGQYWFNATAYDYAMNTNSTGTRTATIDYYKSGITFDALQRTTNAVTPYNVTVTGPVNATFGSNGTSRYLNIPDGSIVGGVYDVTVWKPGYYNCTTLSWTANSTYTFPTCYLFNSNATFTAYDTYTNATISNFSVQYLATSGFNETLTDGTSVSAGLIQGDTYYLLVTHPNYISHSNSTYSPSSFAETNNIGLSQTMTTFRFRHGWSNQIINNVNISLTDTDYNLTFTTSTGEITLGPQGTSHWIFSAPRYITQNATYTFANGSTQTVDVLLYPILNVSVYDEYKSSITLTWFNWSSPTTASYTLYCFDPSGQNGTTYAQIIPNSTGTGPISLNGSCIAQRVRFNLEYVNINGEVQTYYRTLIFPATITAFDFKVFLPDFLDGHSARSI